MGEKGREVVGLDIGKLLEMLNRAFADEWLAYYQYWIASKVIKGPLRSLLEAELVEHAAEELTHAELLAGRILQLGGTPVLDPKDWHGLSNCGYDPPEDPSVEAILEDNIKAERCAIDVYQRILSFVSGKDHVTYNIVLSILSDEVEHEEDLEAIREDVEEFRAKLAAG